MSDKRPELSTKWRMSGKFFETSFNSKSAYIKVPEYIWHWLCDSETISSYILEPLLRLARCWMNAPIYQHNDESPEKIFRASDNAKSVPR